MCARAALRLRRTRRVQKGEQVMSIRSPLVIAGLLGVAILTPGIPVAAASPIRVSLQKSDVPAGYAETSVTPDDAHMPNYCAGVSPAQFGQHGRLTTVVDIFRKTRIDVIVSIVSQYKTTAGAVWEYRSCASSYGSNLKAASAPRVGDRSQGYKKIEKKYGWVSYGIDFQKGVYDMNVEVAGPPGKVSMSQTARYARIMVGRAH